MEQRIPIDIHYNKLLDWLIDRRHCNLKWQQSAVIVREKINNALQDMPQNEEIAKLLSGSYINYFHCLKIVNLLKKCGEGSTNFFGQYSSQRMKDWIDITNIYKEENIHLAEAAHLLMRNVNYEIPCLKKQIGKCQQTQRDCSRKETECASNAAIFKEKYQNDCKQMGVHEDNVKQGLLNLVNELPELFDQISKKTCDLDDAVEYYRAFVDFVVPNNKPTDRTENNINDIVPMIRFISRHGNATVYQWRTGEIPSFNEEKGNIIKNATNLNTNDQSDEIDWGNGEGDEATKDEIDFGDEDGGIDFGENDVEIDFGIEAVEEGNESKIDYGIEAVNSAIETLGNEKIKENMENETEDEAAMDRLSVLENPATRNLFIDDLYEIQSFLSQRLEELSTEGDILSANQFQSAPLVIQIQTKEIIRNMHKKATAIIEDLTSMKMQNLYRLRSSPRYVDRLVDSLQSKLKTAKNLLKQAKIMAERRQAALDLQRQTEPELDLIVQKTKELQKQISEEISNRYNNRMVNIMGEVNAI